LIFFLTVRIHVGASAHRRGAQRKGRQGARRRIKKHEWCVFLSIARFLPPLFLTFISILHVISLCSTDQLAQLQIKMLDSMVKHLKDKRRGVGASMTRDNAEIDRINKGAF
jgi:hypothetical protein